MRHRLLALFSCALLLAAQPSMASTWRDKWVAANHRVGPEVIAAWLEDKKASTLKELEAQGITLPPDFLAWIDSDPIVRTTVYAARSRPADVLKILRSLEIDLGEKTVREDHSQLALALAVARSSEAATVNLNPRGRLVLRIPGDPREPVDTNDPNRPLDRDDHIINFLNSRTITEQVVVGHREEPPPLRYDERGIAIPDTGKGKKQKIPITENRTRTLYAADVMASRALQIEFNAYMKSKGHEVEIDCGDGVIHWKSTAAVRAERKKINEALVLFRTAYERKGLLPEARDPSPGPAESMAWWVRNDAYRFPAETAGERKWPRYPLTSPWPTLTLLAADNQPLREREERWIAFRDKGEMRTYGEYIGPIAQQFDMQSARRLSPHPFHYGTYQMMAKDGGVCGTMANMGVRTYNTLGIPSCTAGQPGHCALIFFQHDPKSGLFECKGGQFATGGPEKTHPHTPFVFGDIDARKPMLYYQTIAWAMNHGFQSWLDSMVCFRMFQEVADSGASETRVSLLEQGLGLNPFNIVLADAAQESIDSPAGQFAFLSTWKKSLASAAKPGCPAEGLYPDTLRDRAFARIAALPVPTDKAAARRILDQLVAANCANAQALVAYRVASNGLDAVLQKTEADFTAHLAGPRTESSATLMAATLEAMASRIEGKPQRAAWLKARRHEIEGHENFLGAKNKIITDACATFLAKATKHNLRDETARAQPVLDQVTSDFFAHVAGPRNNRSCQDMANRIQTIQKQLKDPKQARTWLSGLATAIKGKENFAGPKGKVSADPSARTIRDLLAALPE